MALTCSVGVSESDNLATLARHLPTMLSLLDRWNSRRSASFLPVGLVTRKASISERQNLAPAKLRTGATASLTVRDRPVSPAVGINLRSEGALARKSSIPGT